MTKHQEPQRHYFTGTARYHLYDQGYGKDIHASRAQSLCDVLFRDFEKDLSAQMDDGQRRALMLEMNAGFWLIIGLFRRYAPILLAWNLLIVS